MPRWSNADRTPLGALRSDAGLTRPQAAVALGVAPDTLRRYELGQAELPLGIAEDLAKLYKVPFDDIRVACAAVRRPRKNRPLEVIPMKEGMSDE